MTQAGRTDALAIRTLTEADLPSARALSAAVQWPHRLEDWQFVHGLGIGLAAEADGRLVGTAMAWLLGEGAARIGMVIVAPAHQGRGIGRRMMEVMLPMLSGRSVSLHATGGGAGLYRHLGFVPCGTVRQHQGATFGAGGLAPAEGERIRRAGQADRTAIAALDAAATGTERGRFIAALLERAEAVVLDRGGMPAGFAVLRRFGRGHLIGPVVAPDEAAAKQLIGHWLAQRPGAFLRIDVADAPDLSAWLGALGLATVDEVARMTRGPVPRPRAGRCFALINQALG